MNSRREFLRGTAWMGIAAMAAGCSSNPLKFFGTSGAPMQGFALRPMKRVRVACVGVGSRGTGAVHRIAMIPGTQVVAIADLFQDRIDAQLTWLGDLLKVKIRTVVFAHSPLYWETGDPYDDWFRVLNHREVRSLLEASGCVEAVFQGHHHTFHADRHNGIPYLNIPSPEQTPAYSDDCFPVVRILEDGLTLNGLSYR